MANVNKVFLIGNLTAEPEIRQLPSGDTIASFSLAMNRRYTNARGEQVEDTTFVEIDAFSRLADIIRQFVHKGDPLFVEGRLRQDRWVDKQTNQQRSRLKVVADNIQLLSSRSAGQPGSAAAIPSAVPAAAVWAGSSAVPAAAVWPGTAAAVCASAVSFGRRAECSCAHAVLPAAASSCGR